MSRGYVPAAGLHALPGGVAPNKFLAKIASDVRKPDGLFVIQPHEVDAFLRPLPVGRIPGVGKVMDRKLEALGIRTVVLKVKTGDFRVLARSLTPPAPPASGEALAGIALSLRERVGRPPGSLYRLAGVGLTNFREPEEIEPQPRLFA